MDMFCSSQGLSWCLDGFLNQRKEIIQDAVERDVGLNKSTASGEKGVVLGCPPRALQSRLVNTHHVPLV